MITMPIKINREQCISCGKCIKACPNAALEMTSFGLLVNPKLCDNCGKCIEACNTGAITVE